MLWKSSWQKKLNKILEDVRYLRVWQKTTLIAK
jgi:hypothetical protein